MRKKISKIKKEPNLEQKIKVFLRVGCIVPLLLVKNAIPSYATEINETVGNQSNYMESWRFPGANNIYKSHYSTVEDVISNANYVKTKVFSYGSANVLYPTETGKTLNSLYGLRGVLSGTENALMAKVYNTQNNKYEFKVLTTANNYAALYHCNNYVNSNIFKNQTLVRELNTFIHDDDAQGINNFMSKYLPKYYLVTLTQEELDKAEELAGNWDSGVFSTDNSFNTYISSNPDKCKELDAVHSLYDWGDTISAEGSNTYDSISLGRNETWAPMDRTIQIQGVQKKPFEDQEEYSLNTYWFTKNGATFPGTTHDDDFSQYGDYSENTTLYYDESDEVVPVDDSTYTVVTVGNLTTENNSIINMSWANTNPLSGNTGFNTMEFNDMPQRTDIMTDSWGDEYEVFTTVPRILMVDNARLSEGTTFRLGGYSGLREDWDLDGNYLESRYLNGKFDSVYIQNAIQVDSSSKTNLNIQLGYVPGIEKGNSYGGVDLVNDTGYDGPIPYDNGSWNMNGYQPLLGILNGANHFNVTGQESKADGVFNVYTIKPEIDKIEDFFANEDGSRSGTLWYLTGYTFQNTGEVAESGKTASDNALVNQNLWRGFSDHAFRRPADFHTRYAWSREKKQEARENAWAETWHGRFNSKGDYGRSVGQSYTGMMVGYDKMLNKEYGGGNIYTGVYAARLDGSSHTPSQGRGDQEGSGFGVYGSWVGQKGHYIDAEVSAVKLKNDYHFYGNNGKGLQQSIYISTGTNDGGADTTGNGTYGNVKGENNAWAYGLGLRYGKRSDRGSVWFDPHVSVYAGHIDNDSYTLSNDLIVNTKDWNSLIGKAGVTVGKQLARNKGRIYAGVDIAHEFGGKQEIEQAIAAHAQDGTTGTGRIKARQLAGEQGGHDTWAELKAGGDIALSKATRLHVDYERTLGRKAGNDWNISGRLEVSWDGIGGKGKKGKTEEAKPLAGPIAANDVANALQPDAQAASAASGTAVQDASATAKPETLRNEESRTASVTDQALPKNTAADTPLVTKTAASEPAATANTSENPVIWQGEGDLTGFMLSQITVEAPRPDWEQKLSPGQVTVIDPKEFEGEQKDIPALLERVPGLFVDRQNGQGHYTTARIRGSSAAQVDVYIDGVRANLSGDAAVNLSAIPADNVARIEVYRGYVPARFAGAPLGGVINIVTKKPDSGHGRITQGMRSYGGATTTMEYSTPLGKGSLLATATRDIWDGDFPVKAVDNDYSTKAWRRSNGFRDTDAMLKWQDDHWTVKAQYKHNHEELAPSLSFYNATDPYWRHGYLDSHLDLDYKEFYVGREDNWKDLNLNWHVAYIDSNKKYRNTGMMKNVEDAKAWPPSEDLNGSGPYGEEDDFAGQPVGRLPFQKMGFQP